MVQKEGEEEDEGFVPMDTDGEDLIKQVFDVMDHSHTGFIDEEDARHFIDLTTAGMEDAGSHENVKDQLIAAFEVMDTNHDSKVSYDEWRKGFSHLLKVYKAEHIEGPMLDAIYQLDDGCV